MTGVYLYSLLFLALLATLAVLALTLGPRSRFRALPVPTVPPGEGPGRREVRKRRVVFAVLLLVGLSGAAVLHRFDPTPQPGHRHYYPVCLLHKYTGLYCPGCGTTRALHALVHGRVGTAVRYNQVTILIGLPVVGWAFLRYGVQAIFPGVRLRRWEGRQSLRCSQAIGILVLIFTVLRNVHCTPFIWLAPPEAPRMHPAEAD